MELTFVRHTAVAVAPGTCYGQTDVPLAPTFENEADAVKNALATQQFDAVYCSPLTRCRRLAEHCGMEQIVFDDRLKELNFGEWEMRRFDEINDARLQDWYADYINVRVPGGESFMDQNRRVATFLDELKTKQHRRALIFTHGGVIMQAMLITGLAKPDELFAKQPSYGQIVPVVI